MTRRWITPIALLIAVAGCGRPSPAAAPRGPEPVARGASSAEVDSLWAQANRRFRHGQWAKAAQLLQRIGLEFGPGDPRIPRSHFILAESYLGSGSQLQATREFRRVADETPNHPLAPEALLRAGDAYAELWRRPELDPTYAQTAMATYQELLNRYPESPAATRGRVRVAHLREQFAEKQYRSAMFYFRWKAYDSAILYLKDVVATYPQTRAAPKALVRLVEAYQILGYREDLTETCEYLQRFHPQAVTTAPACAVAADST